MGIPFSRDELTVVGTRTLRTSLYRTEVPIYSFPNSAKEGVLAAYSKKPCWILYNVENQHIATSVIPDNLARGTVPGAKRGGPDMFGVEWEFIEQVGGSMVRPGKPMLESVDEWPEKLKFPDIDSWDWEGCAEEFKPQYDPTAPHVFTFFNGFWFERLISFLDFENAAMALIDEEQQDAVKALFDKTTELACRLVDKACEYFDVDIISVHDDWGTMLSSFFSPATCAEMIVPFMRRLTDHIHSKGKLADFHSCGKAENQIENIIAAGWDSWGPMIINDTRALYQKYGDKILLSVEPAVTFDPETTPEEEQRRLAREYVDMVAVPGKACIFNNYAQFMLTPAFVEEMYIYSREVYGRMY